MLVLVHHHRITFALRHRNRHDLGVEVSSLLRRRGAGVRRQRQLVLTFARDRVLLAQVLRSLDHSARDWVVLAARLLAALLQAVLELHRAALCTPADLSVHGVLGVGHGFRTARDDQVGGTGSHVRRGSGDRLQAGAAAAVQLHAGHVNAQLSVECDNAA